MKLLDKIKKSLDERPVLAWKLRPEVLLLPQIPKPLHGIAPRVVLGNKWWDQTRQEAYKSTDYHCVACGVHKTEARGPKWLEAHEVYRTDYIIGRLYFIEAVPLCHFCHNSIHQGRLQALLDKHQITQRKFTSIIQHGERVLAGAGLVKPPPYEGRMAEWGSWRLVINRRMYKPKFKCMEDWARHFNVDLEE
jgi:hypothetical protein